MRARDFPVIAALVVGAWVLPRPALAAGDEVDQAYAAGTQAAASGDWSGAATSWEKARRILPESNAQLAYDLGTAYAHLGENGYATVHLERARRLDPALDEDARRNLAIVRRQAEITAAAESRELSEPSGWSEQVLAAFASQLVAWMALLAGWFAFVAWLIQRRRAPVAGQKSGGLSALALFAALIFTVAGLGHFFARDSASVAGEMIVLHEGVGAREGPGSHQAAAFTIAAGSRVLEEERRSGWVMVRISGGLAGWVPSESVARIDAPEAQVPSPTAINDGG